MLRVTIELIPFGNETKSKTLYKIDIANDGTGTREYGNYRAKHNNKDIWKEKVVTKWPRVEGAIYLVIEVLKELYERK